MDQTMRIGFLGAGEMTRALALPWLAAGHEVTVGGRDRTKAMALAAELGARAASLPETAERCEVAILAVRWEGVEWTLETVGDRLRGKVLVDVTNPVEVEDFGLVTSPGTSMGEQVQRTTGAQVVKAFNLAQTSVWTSPRQVDGRPLVVPVATDDAGARATAEVLAGALGAAVLDAGELRHARHLEAMAAVVIRRLFSGDPASSTFAWVA